MDGQMMISQTGRNRFDDLPEEVVMHIFSFLPTRYAVKASLSCKAWKYLWMSPPNLRFKEYETETGSSVPNLSKEERQLLYIGWLSTPNLSIEQLRSKQSKKELFLEFVSRVIRFRKPLKINEFSIGLDWNGNSNAYLIRGWIEYAVNHGVEVFHLRLFCDTRIRPLRLLPAALFSCKSLTEMHIEMDGILVLPSTLFHFPTLKILRFVGVWFCNTPLAVSQLFSNCPLLEELHLLECSMGYHSEIHISAPRLTSLSITELDDTQFFPQRCQFIIHGTNLKRFIYQGQFRDDYLFVNSPSLQEACIRIQLLNDVEHKKVAGQAYGLLEELYNVNFLSISHGTLQFFDKEKDMIFTKLPVFHNLSHLQLTHGRVDISSNGLLSLLVKSPSLHHLEFTEGSQIVNTNITKVMELWPTVQCLLTSLQNITVAKFYGESEEYNGLKVFLMISRVLEKLHLNFMGGTTAEREILRRLAEMFPKEMLQLISIRSLDKEAIIKVRNCFAGLWSLDDSGIITKAIESPELFVMKPQREGGGNNIDGDDKLLPLRNGGTEEISAYILNSNA